MLTWTRPRCVRRCGGRDDLRLYRGSRRAGSINPPYPLAFVDLDDGLRILAQGLTPAEELRTGQRVRLVPGQIGTTPDGKAMYSYVFDGGSGNE